MTAAIEASGRGKSAVILEKNPRVGKKLLQTGNGRCNLSHAPLLTENNYFGDILLADHALNNTDLPAFFESIGIITTADESGRVYPHSGTAASVLDALRLECRRLGVTEQTEFKCVALEKSDDVFTAISANNERVSARNAVVATGSPASADDVLLKQLTARFGHAPVPFAPALCPLITDERLVRSLKGLRVSANCKLISGERVVAEERGEVQFGENYLSGICVMNLSCFVNHGENFSLSLDLAPDFTEKDLVLYLRRTFEKRKAAANEDKLTGILQKRLALLIDISSPHITAKHIKDFRFPVMKKAELSKAQTAVGGIRADEVDDRFQSVKTHGLFFCGESLNVFGRCGGYNLAFAFASGIKVGKNIV